MEMPRKRRGPHFRWTSVGRPGRHGRSEKRHDHVNFIRVDKELGQQFPQFMNLEFSESVSDPRRVMSRQDEKVLTIYEESACLADGHYETAIP